MSAAQITLEERIARLEKHAGLLEGACAEAQVNSSVALVLAERLAVMVAAQTEHPEAFLAELERQSRERITPQTAARETALAGAAMLKRLKQVIDHASAPFRPKN